MKKIDNIGVILSGGKGVRAGGNMPKQYHKVCGKMIIEYVVEAFKESNYTDVVIIAAEECWHEELNRLGCICISGGLERNDTIQNVIDYVKENIPTCKKILFHDAARPRITSRYIDECFTLLDSYEAVITTAHITDSLGKKHSRPIDRSNYYLIQTPEAFQFDILEQCFTKDSEWTAIVQQLPEQSSVFCNYNFAGNLKITYPNDFEYFQQMIEREQKE